MGNTPLRSARERELGYRKGSRDLRTSLPSKVSFFENIAVVQFVPGNDIGERSHGDVVLVSDALPGPILSTEVAEQREGRGADAFEFFHQVREEEFGVWTVADEIVLLVAFQGRTVVACDPQGAV